LAALLARIDEVFTRVPALRRPAQEIDLFQLTKAQQLS
jgi:hypothetical protein